MWPLVHHHNGPHWSNLTTRMSGHWLVHHHGPRSHLASLLDQLGLVLDERQDGHLDRRDAWLEPAGLGFRV